HLVRQMRRKRIFLLIATAVTTWWILTNLPRLTLADKWGAGWEAGWPLGYERWGAGPDGVVDFHEFSPGALLINVGIWLAVTGLVCFFTWPRPQRRSYGLR